MTSNRFIYLILAAFITGMLLLIYIQYNSSRSIHQLTEGNELLLRELKIGNDLREMERDILSVESKIRASVATGDTSFVEGIDSQIANAEANLDTLRIVNTDPASVADIDRLSILAREKLVNKKLMLDSFFHTGRLPDRSVIANPRTRGAANEINSIIRRLYSKREERMALLNRSVQQNGRIARTSGIILITLVLLTGSGLFWYIINRIRKQNELIHRLDTSERNLQEALRVKENFMTNMSHEIRTPLNSIIGFAALLEKQPVNETAREFISAISQSGQNLLAIINDILDLSKIEAGMMRLESNPFSVRELLHSIETLFHHRITGKGLTHEFIIEENVPDILLGDATRLTQILVNLVGNALKFTETGKITIRVSATSRDTTTQLRIAITDTGIGISPTQLSSIFERFSQAEDSITRKYGGTGLGLAIVKDLIELQHGHIEVESQPGRGTSFCFEIPYMTLTQPLTKATPAHILVHADSACILVADDNKMNQQLMRHLLGGQGLSFDLVDNGRQAIEHLREKKYDLVLMDIQMPLMDGYTASRYIRDSLGSAVPIVAMTAHAMPGEKERCLASGMNDYLSKPIDETALWRMLTHFLQAPGVPAETSEPAETGAAGSEANPASRPAEHSTATPETIPYRFIDPSYLQQLSGGDRAYEIELTDQFLEAIPTDLADLHSALAADDKAAVSRIAHNMKTTVSIMGMTERLHILLDSLEYPEGFTDLSTLTSSLAQVAELAMQEARRFRR